ERIGWTRGLTVLKERVRELRPVFAPPDPASRTTYQPGELAQCDLWFPPVDVPLSAGQGGGNRNDVTQLLPLTDKLPPGHGCRGRRRRRPPTAWAAAMGGRRVLCVPRGSQSQPWRQLSKCTLNSRRAPAVR